MSLSRRVIRNRGLHFFPFLRIKLSNGSLQECALFWSNISGEKGQQGGHLLKTKLDGWNTLSRVPIFILTQHFNTINQQKKTVVLHSIPNISGLSDSFKDVD